MTVFEIIGFTIELFSAIGDGFALNNKSKPTYGFSKSKRTSDQNEHLIILDFFNPFSHAVEIIFPGDTSFRKDDYYTIIHDSKSRFSKDDLIGRKTIKNESIKFYSSIKIPSHTTVQFAIDSEKISNGKVEFYYAFKILKRKYFKVSKYKLV